MDFGPPGHPKIAPAKRRQWVQRTAIRRMATEEMTMTTDDREHPVRPADDGEYHDRPRRPR